MTGPRTERKWLAAALVCLYAGLFVWLRYWSGLWQNRWVGFVLGGVTAAVILLTLGAQESNAWRYDIPKRAFLISSVALLIIGVQTIRHFFQGGAGDDGLAGLVLLASAIGAAYVYYRLLKNSAKLPDEEQ
jgi:hypothetical protein